MAVFDVENAIFITKIDNVKYVSKKYQRLYFGNEFCEKLIPSANDLKRALDYCHGKRLKFSLVTPYVSQAGLERLESLLAWLHDQQIECEIVFNDYGVLDLIHERYRNFSPVAGRMLTKQKRDPRISALIRSVPGRSRYFRKKNFYCVVVPKKIPQTLVDYYRETNINIPMMRTFFKKYGVKRAEIDNLLQGVNLRSPIGRFFVSLYVPYGYITTTRLCLANPFRQAEKFSCKISSCRKECQQYRVELTSPLMPVPLLAKGNTIFFENKIIPSTRKLKMMGINRIVVQPELPV